jgi:hypothetical protein
VVTSKEKATKDGEKYSVLKDMPTEASEKALASHIFIEAVDPIDEIHGVPLPKLSGKELTFLVPGYDEETRVFTFEL